MIWEIGQTVCFATWVQNKGFLSMFCIAMGVLIGRNAVDLFRSESILVTKKLLQAKTI